MSTKFYAGQKDYIPKLNEMDQAFQDAISYLVGSTASPLPAGTASPGTVSKYAREDHVHPFILVGTGFTYDPATGKLTSSATAANTASSIVQRDASGNFSAGTITANLTGNVTGNVTGNINGNVTGNVSGNAGTATKLQTTRNINGTAFDGTADISFTTDAVNEGATNKYYTDARTRAAISVTGVGITYNSATGQLTSNATSANTASTVVSRDSSGNFSAGTITANLTGAVNGNASTATKLATARTINGASFDGSANISFTTDAVNEGATNQYFTVARVRSAVLTGIDLTVNAVVSATDTVLSALGKLQKQLSDLTTIVSQKANSANSSLTGTTVAQNVDISTMLEIPTWTTATRPANANGRIGYNTDLKAYEGYNDTAWSSLGGGARGAPANPVFYENDSTVTGDYTVTTGKNAMSAGPISVNTGVTVTIPSGSVWTIV